MSLHTFCGGIKQRSLVSICSRVGLCYDLSKIALVASFNFSKTVIEVVSQTKISNNCSLGIHQMCLSEAPSPSVQALYWKIQSAEESMGALGLLTKASVLLVRKRRPRRVVSDGTFMIGTGRRLELEL